MSSQWYYLDKGRVHGPMSSSQLWLSAMEGFIDTNTPVRKGAEGKWVPASKVRGLLSPQGAMSSTLPDSLVDAAKEQAEEKAAIPVALAPVFSAGTRVPMPDAALPGESQFSQSSPQEPQASLSGETPSRSRAKRLVLLLGGLVAIAGLLLLGAVGTVLLRGGDPAVSRSATASAPFEKEALNSTVRKEIRGPVDELPVVHSLDSAATTLAPPSPPLPAADSPYDEDRTTQEKGSEIHTRSESDVPSEPWKVRDQPEDDKSGRQPASQVAPSVKPDEECARSPQQDAPSSRGAGTASFLDLDEAERHIDVLGKLHQNSEKLFADIREGREKTKELAHAVDGLKANLTLLQRQLFDANRILQAYQVERQRILRRTPGAVTPVFDNNIRVAAVKVNEISAELKKQGYALEGRLADAKGGREKENALLAEANKVVDDWFAASAPFGGLLDKSYRQIADQTTHWIGQSPQFPLTYLTRALARTHLREFDEILDDYRSGIKEFPDLEPLVTAAYGYTLCVQGDLRRAGDQFRKAEDSSADATWIHVFWGYGLNAAQKPHLAVGHFDKVLRLDPKSFFAHEALAMLAIERVSPSLDAKYAIQHAEIACDLNDWSEWQPVSTLAMAYAGTDQFGLAAEMAKRALARAPKCRRAELQTRLQEYETEARRPSR